MPQVEFKPMTPLFERLETAQLLCLASNLVLQVIITISICHILEFTVAHNKFSISSLYTAWSHIHNSKEFSASVFWGGVLKLESIGFIWRREPT
jgi:hypothetical protein